jgi:2-keto-myo-inositol isomerase
VLVGPDDVLGNIDQVRQLMTVTEGPWSFEPFASEVGESPTLAQDLRASLAYVRDPIAD